MIVHIKQTIIIIHMTERHVLYFVQHRLVGLWRL